MNGLTRLNGLRLTRRMNSSVRGPMNSSAIRSKQSRRIVLQQPQISVPSMNLKTSGKLHEVRQPDFDGFVTALNECDRVAAWLKFKDICFDHDSRLLIEHCHLLKLMDLLLLHRPPKIRSMAEIISIADQLALNPSASMYARLIRAYGTIEDIPAARNVLQQMRDNGLELTIDIYNEFMRIVASISGLSTAKAFVAQVRRENVALDSQSYAILIQCALAENMLDDALAYAKEAFDCGLSNTELIYEQLVGVYFALHDFDAVMDVFNDMRISKSIKPHVGVASSLCIGMVNANKMSQADEILAWMLEHGLKPSTKAFMAVIEAKCHASDYKDAMRVLSAVETLYSHPDPLIYVAVMRGLCDTAQIDDALALLENMHQKLIKPSVGLYKVLLNALVEHKRPKDVYSIYKHLEETTSLALDEHILKAMLSACGMALDLQTMVSVWSRAKAQLGPANIAANTYLVVLSSFIKCHDVQSALDTCFEMVSHGYEPGTEEMLGLLAICTESRDFEGAAKIMNIMRLSLRSHGTSIKGIVRRYSTEFEGLIRTLAQTDDSKFQHSLDDPDKETTIKANVSRSEIAIALYKELIAANVIPSEETLRMAMDTHRKRGDLIGVVKVWTTITQNIPKPSPESAALLIRAASELGQHRMALAVKNMVENDKIPLNREGMEGMAILCARCGSSDSLISVLVDIISNGHPLTNEMYSRIDSAFLNAVPKDPYARKRFHEFVDEQFPEIIVQDLRLNSQ